MLRLLTAAFATTVLNLQAGVTLANVHSFGVFTNGEDPSGLVQGSDGSFYGTTSEAGGTNNAGTVFRISASGVFTSLYSFTGGKDGGNPQAGLVQGSDGNFYGTTGWGGNGGNGVVFRLSVALPGLPSLQFSASPTAGVAPLTVQFNSPSVDSSGNSIVSWNWNFGDGGVSTLQNPSHT